MAASFFIASFASYVALDLAKRVRTPDRGVARTWWACGSVAMGTGIWCMHFVGMLAFTLPIALGYGAAMTVSWLAAVAVSAVALGIASQRTHVLGAPGAGRRRHGPGHLRDALRRHGGAGHGAGHRLEPRAGGRVRRRWPWSRPASR